jgi:hypothetical protein
MKSYFTRLSIAAVLVGINVGQLQAEEAAVADSASDSDKFNLVIANEIDAPRYTPLTRRAMKQYIEQLKDRTPRIDLPELTAAEKQEASENGRRFGYESRLRELYLPADSGSGYMVFGGSSARANSAAGGASGSASGSSPAAASANRRGGRGGMPADPNLSLDYAFKVRLFWIAARANNCQYCLGHQESKLLSAGMSEDEIAALDSDWERFPEKERVAFALARRLTLTPHLLSDDAIIACQPYYTDLQILEMVGSISGNNAINRWKEGCGIPQSGNGGNFGGRGGEGGSGEAHSYLTATSEEFANRPSKVVYTSNDTRKNDDLVLTVLERPALESGEELEKLLASVKNRQPLLPIVSQEQAREVLGDDAGNGEIPQWKCLLARFPVAGKRLVQSIAISESSSELSPALQAEINWVVARQDRAWYNMVLAMDQLTHAGLASDITKTLDTDLTKPASGISDRDRALLLVARNVAASPIVLTDKQVTDAVELAGPKAVTQVINYTAYRAMLNRITEAARLSH